MPRKVFLPREQRFGGGGCFHVTWNRIEDFLRGEPDKLAYSNARVNKDEICDFVVGDDGITVYVEKKT